MAKSTKLAGEPWSANPTCVSPSITSFLIAWNDALDDETRQRLKPYAQRVIGTRGDDALELRLAWMATDWLARTFAPAWLSLAGFVDHAASLRALPALETDELANAAIATIRAAWSAAESAAWSAAESAAWSAAWSALEPTILLLQESSFQLLDRMIDVAKSSTRKEVSIGKIHD